MADAPPNKSRRKPRYTTDSNAPGAFEGETVTRRGFMSANALAIGGIATAAFGLPALGFALGPVLEDGVSNEWQDIGAEADFSDATYTSVVANIVAELGEAGKTTVYVRKFNTERDSKSPSDKGDPQPYVAVSTRCSHLGCPVRYYQAAQRFVCPCHGGVYDYEGKVAGGPPVRPLDRFYTRVVNGRVEMGQRFSVNSELRRFSPRDPGEPLDGLWEYLYPARPST